ncbi:hypothetical protein BEST7613_2304 [Synechocystis sp. PCC 6803]|nr:hypothetical protein BEST7613_2304 [Synechocystis sp. PCC 6803] [Bacillus subtilis BEST7613]
MINYVTESIGNGVGNGQRKVVASQFTLLHENIVANGLIFLGKIARNAYLRAKSHPSDCGMPPVLEKMAQLFPLP